MASKHTESVGCLVSIKRFGNISIRLFTDLEYLLDYLLTLNVTGAVRANMGGVYNTDVQVKDVILQYLLRFPLFIYLFIIIIIIKFYLIFLSVK